MAKKSSIEKNNRRMRLAKQYAAKRTKLKAAAVDPNLGDQERFAARLKLTELPRNSSPQSGAQPLRDHRPSARQLPQAQDEPHRAAGHGQRREDPRHGEVELVRKSKC